MVLNLWVGNYGIKDDGCFSKKEVISEAVVDLFCNGSVIPLKLCLEQKDSNSFKELIEDLNTIQLSSYALSAKQWQKITSLWATSDEIRTIHLLSEAIRICVLNWLRHQDSVETKLTTEQQIAKTVRQLVLESGWRFKDVSLLFTFNQKKKCQILSLLNIVYEYKLEGEMLKKLPNDCSDNDLKNFIQYVTKQVSCILLTG